MPFDPTDPTRFPSWDDLLLTHPDYCFFHTSAWARVLHESYGYRPLYFTDTTNGQLKTLVPMMEVRSLITGKRGVSLPFTDMCPIIVPDTRTFDDIFDLAREHGKKSGWKYIEFRGAEAHLRNEPASSTYYTHELDLGEAPDRVLARFRNSTKRNIKKAIKQGVVAELSSSLESVREFYHLNCITRRRHGLPPQPFRFFRELHEHVLSKGKGFVCLGRYGGRPIAGVIFLILGQKAVYKYGASDMKYQQLRANNLVMWEAIKGCIEKGCNRLNLGRTEPGNDGLLQFKRGWGSQERPMKYYRYDLREDRFVEHGGPFKESYNIVKRMPLWLLSFAGSLFYKHVA